MWLRNEGFCTVNHFIRYKDFGKLAADAAQLADDLISLSM